MTRSTDHGSARIARAILLQANADLALQGILDWPPDFILEVLVARLAADSRAARPAHRRTGALAPSVGVVARHRLTGEEPTQIRAVQDPANAVCLS